MRKKMKINYEEQTHGRLCIFAYDANYHFLKEIDSKICKRCDYFKISAVQIKIMTCVSAFFKDHGFSF